MGISSGLSSLLKGAKNITKKVKNIGGKVTHGIVDEVSDVADDLGMEFSLNGFESGVKKTYDSYRGNKDLWKHMTKENVNKNTQGQGLKGALKRGGTTLGLGVEDTAEKLAAGTVKLGYKVGKGTAKALFKKPVRNEERFFGYDLKATPLGHVAFMGAAAFGTVGLSALENMEKSDHGEINGGLMAKSVNATFAQGTSNVFDAAQSGAMSMRKFNKTAGSNNMSARFGNVNPDIVFAMHTLRNNQDMLNQEVVH